MKYKIIAIENGMVVTDDGNFPSNNFILGINGLEVGKTYTFEFRGNGRILRFYEMPDHPTAIS